jgi:hypothetical protein
MATLTQADWKKIYAKAYNDEKFRTKLETDPTGAIQEYHRAEHGKEMAAGTPIVDLSDWLKNSDEGWPPVACC